jgi:hypothetical protein
MESIAAAKIAALADRKAILAVCPFKAKDKRAKTAAKLQSKKTAAEKIAPKQPVMFISPVLEKIKPKPFGG